MRRDAASIKFAALAALLAALPVQAEVLSARIAALRTGAGELEQVQVRLDWPRGAAQGRLRVQAARLDFPALSYQARSLDWSCPLQRGDADRWTCAGPITTQGSKPQQLAIEFSPQETIATLRAQGATVRYRSASALDGQHQVRVDKLPVAWLGAFLGGLWADGRWSGARLDGTVVVGAPDAGPFAVDADLQLAGLDLETPDGLLAAAGLTGRLQVAYRDGGGSSAVDARLRLAGGELLYGKLYTKVESPVTARVLARRRGEGAWSLPTLEWRDPGVLVATGSAGLAADASVDSLAMALQFPDLSRARDRYFSGVLAPAGFPDLVLAGRAEARVTMRGGAVSDLHARLHGVNAVDAKARFTFAGVDGELAWTRGAESRPSELRWGSGALFGIGLGPARFPLRSAGGELALTAPVAIAALEGRLRLEQLRWQAPTGAAGARFQFGLGVEDLDLGSLSQRLGWPAFTGKVNGSIPSARYQDDVLAIDGALQMQLFGGRIAMDQLVLERPFASAPVLSADVDIQDIDLEPLTKVFGFGAITGRLDGRIDDLRLVGWSPVAFDARLQTDPAHRGKKRISQRAVKDISDVGGSGLAGGLQARALKLFDDFGYSRIGWGCVLRENVCTMSGVGSAGDGYIIVEGAGLPRIQVVGFRRKVDWPTLVSRLEAATEGQAPVIQ